MMRNFRPFVSLIAVLFLAMRAHVDFVPSSVAATVQDEKIQPPATRSTEELHDQNKFYDVDNPEYRKLQKANESLSGFPLDKTGYVDWMKALRTGAIKPRANLFSQESMQVLDLEVVLKNTKEMPYVKFPHKSHTEWLACSNCHDKIFVPKAGANPITMDKIFQGKYCGVCHDRVAFITYFSCERCHSVPHGDIKPWW